jgi:hypothetical protein
MCVWENVLADDEILTAVAPGLPAGLAGRISRRVSVRREIFR